MTFLRALHLGFRFGLAALVATSINLIDARAGAGLKDIPEPGFAPVPLAPQLSIRKDAPLDEQPFWRRKPELTAKIRTDRAVVVSVKHENVRDLVSFTMVGVGLVSKPKDFCFTVSQRYDRLKEVSDHFKAITFTPANQQLFVITEALGYQARMILQMQPVSEDWRSELQWEVIWGHFKGMKGLIGFEKVDETHTEVSLNAKYEAKELPLPKVLMGFALEVITQKVAERMRAFIEAQPAVAAEETAKKTPDPQTSIVGESPKGIATIRLPPGFTISVFAEGVKNARQMTLSPAGTLFVGTHDEGAVYAIPDAAEAAKKGEHAKSVLTIAQGLNEPNGVAFHSGSLYVAEVSRILRYDEIEPKLKAPPKAVVVRDDFPKDKWHGWKYIAIGPDGWLYVPVGAPCNLCVVDNRIYASITRMSLDGKKREIFAEGVRNTVGFDWHPRSHELWFTDNGADMMGDDRPTDELNRAPKAGLNFGFPYCHQGDIKDAKFGTGKDCTTKGPYRYPQERLDPHGAALGMKFYTGSMFPAEYKGRVFIAEHGSWNRSKKIGYRIISVPVDGIDRTKHFEVFAEGWLQGENAWGRPVDVLVMPDGSLLVSDDQEGLIYRISYRKPG